MTYEPPRVYRVRYLVCPECRAREKIAQEASDPWLGRLCTRCGAKGLKVKMEVETTRAPRPTE